MKKRAKAAAEKERGLSVPVIRIGAVSVSAAALFFISMLWFTGFKLSAPLDDAFIYFQYAKNMMKGG
ncbi:MAG TPA: hypothetical protein ENN43_02450, partial [bacterium]|nr:hypothetical protein [bacterium]